MWRCLRGDDKEEVRIEDVKTLIKAIMNIHYDSKKDKQRDVSPMKVEQYNSSPIRDEEKIFGYF